MIQRLHLLLEFPIIRSTHCYTVKNFKSLKNEKREMSVLRQVSQKFKAYFFAEIVFLRSLMERRNGYMPQPTAHGENLDTEKIAWLLSRLSSDDQDRIKANLGKCTSEMTFTRGGKFLTSYDCQ
jgi:hypothetical protein